MSKMRKEYDPNKVKRRKRKPIVYIICEGKETETLYFKHFRSRNCLVDIMILSILVDTFISKISFPMQPGPEIGSISDA